MNQHRWVKGRDGKFQGSIGGGKTPPGMKPPTPTQPEPEYLSETDNPELVLDGEQGKTLVWLQIQAAAPTDVEKILLGENPETPTEWLEMLSSPTQNRFVRYSTLHNPNCPRDVLHQLLVSTSPANIVAFTRVAQKVFTHPNCHPADQDALWHHPLLDGKLGSYPNGSDTGEVPSTHDFSVLTSLDDYGELVCGNPGIVLEAIQHPDCPPWVLERLAVTHPDRSVRVAASQHPSFGVPRDGWCPRGDTDPFPTFWEGNTFGCNGCDAVGGTVETRTGYCVDCWLKVATAG